MKLLFVFGTRPEAIKMAPLVQLANASQDLESIVAVTGQHRQMLDQILNFFDIKCDFDLNLMRKRQSLSQITTEVICGLEPIIKDVKPDIVLVHGDTTTSFAAALTAFYNEAKVGHVEAGLRTSNIFSPWPEEANRQLTARLTTMHFSPTPQNKQNLIKEGVPEEKVFVTGNTVIDALRYTIKKFHNTNELNKSIHPRLHKIGLTKNILDTKYLLITGHRRENFGVAFNEICDAIIALSVKHQDINFIWPVHLNPEVKSVVFEKLNDYRNIFLVPPLDYEIFVFCMANCYFIISDSGGIQEEAAALGKPVLITRENTERPEALSTKGSVLVGSDAEKIISTSSMLLNDAQFYEACCVKNNTFGQGDASEKIIEIIKDNA